MKTSTIVAIGFLTLFITVVFFGFIYTVSLSNKEVGIRNQFKQKMDERTAFYDKMWKILSQKSKVATRNDSSFKDNVHMIMAGRKDSEQVFMKWITESNPNANYSEVSALYKDLSRAVEGQRDSFFEEEKMIQSIVMEHDNLMDKFPSGFILSGLFSREHLKYKPITSDRTDDVIKTGKDNDVELF